MGRVVKLKRIIVALMLGIVLYSCSSGKPEIVKLSDPCPNRAASYRSQPTIKELLSQETHAAIVELKDIQPWGETTGQSVFTFSVLSLLAGEKHSDTIQVINPTPLYEYGENYLLFLSCLSSTIYPFDIYVPFDPYTFRITEGEYIDCLQSVEDSESGTPRTFVQPFKTPEHNRLCFLKEHIKKHSGSVRKSTTVSENKDLLYLLEESELILEIVPTTIEPINPFLLDVWYEITACFQGECPLDNWLMLPNSIEQGCQYLVFLTEKEPGFYTLTTRGSFFQQGSQEYDKFLAIWNNK